MTCITKVYLSPTISLELQSTDFSILGEGHFDDVSAKPSGAATPVSTADGPPAKRRKGMSKKAKTLKQRLAVADGSADPSTFQ
jgi:DNA helicase INO80